MRPAIAVRTVCGLLAAAPAAWAQGEEVVVIVLGWEAFVALALAVIVVLCVAAILDALRSWFRRRRPSRKRICYLKMGLTGGVHECVYDGYEAGVRLGQFTWPLGDIARGAERELPACPKVLHISGPA